MPKLEAAAKTAADLQATVAKAAEEAGGSRRPFEQCADDEAIRSPEQEPCCISFLFANITCWIALAQKFIVHQCRDCHVVSSAESHFIRERNSCVGFFETKGGAFFAAASPSSKSVKGSHGGVLAGTRSSLQLGEIVANVDEQQGRMEGP